MSGRKDKFGRPTFFCKTCNIWIDNNSESIRRHEGSARHKATSTRNMASEKKKKAEAEGRATAWGAEVRDTEKRAKLAMAQAKSNKAGALMNWAMAQNQYVDTELVKRKIEREISLTLTKKREEELKKAQDTGVVWHQYYSPEGYPYWYNVVTEENTWENPFERKPLEDEPEVKEDTQPVTLEQAIAAQSEVQNEAEEVPKRMFTKKEWNLLTEYEREKWADFSPYPKAVEAIEEVEEEAPQKNTGLLPSWQPVSPKQQTVYEEQEEGDEEEGEENEEQGAEEEEVVREEDPNGGDSDDSDNEERTYEKKQNEKIADILKENAEPIKFNKRTLPGNAKTRNFRRKTE